MRKGYRIIFETFDLDNPIDVFKQSVLMQEEITKPTSCLDFSVPHEKQTGLIKKALDNILNEKASLLNEDLECCSKCSSKLTKKGMNISTFNDIFTDHDISIRRLRCSKCEYEPPATVRTFIGTNSSSQLSEMQALLGSKHTFRESEELFAMFSAKKRKINHNRIKIVTEEVGEILEAVNKEEKELIKIEDAEELVLNIDGGHIKSKDPDVRTFEALTSVIYRPDSIKSNKKGTRNYLSNKSCAASTTEGEKEIIENTIIAALKEGMTDKTHITTLSDGARNCWNVAESLKPLCGGMTCILDWFHLSMKMQNIALPEELKMKFSKIKWHLWRGNVNAAIIRINQLIEKTSNNKVVNKLNKFLIYIQNNKDKIVNYKERKDKGLVFTSNLAESTVESLINQRCKGQQHMKWTREGLNPILQIRAHLNSRNWSSKWKTVMINYANSFLPLDA